MNPGWLIAALLAAHGAQAQDLQAPGASIQAPETAPAGSTVLVEWTGPDGKGDHITVGRLHSPDADSINSSKTDIGSPLKLLLPDGAGTYELRYLSKSGTVLARRPIETTPVEATLEFPEQAPAGAVLLVEWTGPAYERDFIAVGDPAEVGRSIHYTYARDDTPLRLQLPGEPGTYEVRYVLGQSGDFLAAKLVEVTPVEASLETPATAPAGSTIQVGWDGPGYDNDYIVVSETGTRDKDYLNYTMVSKGDPVPLQLPMQAGTYEVRYVLGESHGVLARTVIEAAPVESTLQAPEKAKAGTSIQVRWTGPGYQGDYIAVAELGTRSSTYVHYVDTSKGNPVRLKLPKEPGEYELRYIAKQDNTRLARKRIVVE